MSTSSQETVSAVRQFTYRKRLSVIAATVHRGCIALDEPPNAVTLTLVDTLDMCATVSKPKSRQTKCCRGNSASASSNGHRRQSVMLVDYHPMTCAGIAHLVNAQMDLRVCCEANERADALALVAEHAPDLLITGLCIPGGGFELIERFHAKYPEIPVLVISMRDELLNGEAALRAGARGYIMKDARAEQILVAIRRVLAGEVYVSPRLGERIFEAFSKGHQSASVEELLSPREFEIFKLLGEGKGCRETAVLLGLSSKTVESHRTTIKVKLKFTDHHSLLRYAIFWVEQQKSVPAGR